MDMFKDIFNFKKIGLVFLLFTSAFIMFTVSAKAEVISLQGGGIVSYETISFFVVVDNPNLTTFCKLDSEADIIVANNSSNYIEQFDEEDNSLNQWVIDPSPELTSNEGNHSLHCYQAEVNGNNPTAGEINNFTIDLSPPVKPTISGANLTNSHVPSFIITKAEDNGFTFCKLGNNDYYLVTSGNSYSDNPVSYKPSDNYPGNIIPEGEHVLSCYQEDEAGNNGAIDTYSFMIDSTAPQTLSVNLNIGKVTELPDTSYIDTPNFILSNADNDTIITCRVDNINDLTITDGIIADQKNASLNSPLNDGEHSLRCIQKDASNNQSTVDYLFIVDTATPSAPIINGASSTNSHLPSFTITNVPSGGHVFCKINNGPEIEVNAPNYIYAPGYLNIGSHIINCKNIGSNTINSLLTVKNITIVEESSPPADPPVTNNSPTCAFKIKKINTISKKGSIIVGAKCDQQVVISLAGNITIKLKKANKTLKLKKTNKFNLSSTSGKITKENEEILLTVKVANNDLSKLKTILKKKLNKGNGKLKINWVATNNKKALSKNSISKAYPIK